MVSRVSTQGPVWVWLLCQGACVGPQSLIHSLPPPLSPPPPAPPPPGRDPFVPLDSALLPPPCLCWSKQNGDPGYVRVHQEESLTPAWYTRSHPGSGASQANSIHVDVPLQGELLGPSRGILLTRELCRENNPTLSLTIPRLPRKSYPCPSFHPKDSHTQPPQSQRTT